jgi:hypothetical protein
MSFTEPSGPSLAADEAAAAASLAAFRAEDTARDAAYEAALQDGPPGNTPSLGQDPTAGPSPQPLRSPNVDDPRDVSQNYGPDPRQP